MEQLSRDARAAIHLGDRRDFVDLRVVDGILVIELVGAPDCDLIYHAINEGCTSGLIDTAMAALVDAQAFHGSINWGSIKAISNIADWSRGGKGTPRVAYLNDDPFFAMVIKSISVLFPRARHSLFSDREAALDWLRVAPMPICRAS